MTFIVFWAAVFAIILFLAGVICKGLAAMFNAATVAIGGILKELLYVIICEIGLYLTYLIIDGIIREGFISVLGTVLKTLFYIAFFWFLLGEAGGTICGLGLGIVSIIVDTIALALETVADTCERAYEYFLNVIIKQIKKC